MSECERYITYGGDDEAGGGATFVPKCERCHRYVTPPATVKTGPAGLSPEPNAVCTRCGPTHMLFQGFL